MAADTTASSYWLNWRVVVCALILLTPLVVAAILIWKYEGKRRVRESQRELPGTLFQDEAWTTCLKRKHPLWLLAFRVFSFVAMLSLLISNVVRDGGGIFYFYTQWVINHLTSFWHVWIFETNEKDSIFFFAETGGHLLWSHSTLG